MKKVGILIAIVAALAGFWIIPTLKLYATDPVVALVRAAFPALDDLNVLLLSLIPFFLIVLVVFIVVNLGRGKGANNG